MLRAAAKQGRVEAGAGRMLAHHMLLLYRTLIWFCATTYFVIPPLCQAVLFACVPGALAYTVLFF